MQLDKAIEKRCSCRDFKSKKPDWRKIIEAIDKARLAPLAGNIPTLKFILVSDKDTIKKLGKATNQDFVSQVHYIVVFVSSQKQLVRSYDKRGEKYCRQQAGAAIENFLLKLADLDLSTCWVGAFADDSVKSILKIPQDMDVEALFPIGYAVKEEKQRKKPELDSCIYFDKWDNKYMRYLKKPDA
jgi:nitroreductase